VFSKRMLAGIFSDAKNHSLRPQEYLIQSYQPRQVTEAFALYQKRLKEANALDFDDLLLKTIELFEKRPDILQKYRDRFRYILVDEYQDTNMAQYHIVSLLAKEHRNLCVVGDDDQSIYGWRGADIRNILEFEKDFPGAHVVRLEQNYRSTDRILEAANRVIENNHGRKSKRLWTDKKDGFPITVYEGRTEREEAVYICDRILNGRRMGSRYDSFAVLYRTHAQSRILEMILQSYSIPYKVYGGTSFFNRSEVKDVLSYLRLLSNPNDDVAFTRIINVPRRGIGNAALEELRAEAQQRGLSLFAVVLDPQTMSLRTRAKFAPFAQIMETAFEEYGQKPFSVFAADLLKRIRYDAYLKEDKKENYEVRSDNVKELLGYMSEFEESFDDPDGDLLQSFLNTVALFMNADNVDEQNGCVNLMTLHAAKGLEFDTVFLCGMEEGLFPSSQSKFDPEKLEEERRLCYVGVTRAREKLYLTFAGSRMLYGQFTASQPSSFLREMGDAIQMPGEYRSRADRKEQASKPPVESFHAQPAPARTPPQVFLGTKPAAAPKATDKVLDWQDGDRVRHAIFGEGVVEGVEGKGPSQIVRVRFKNGVEKRLTALYAPLTRLEN
ncbi:MAG: UvrD-helicase domain-containing protein, partial [Clostridia bacterium]|nr:UvrD-helicase domain-containing protein [Clostridia bacterium]